MSDLDELILERIEGIAAENEREEREYDACLGVMFPGKTKPPFIIFTLQNTLCEFHNGWHDLMEKADAWRDSVLAKMRPIQKQIDALKERVNPQRPPLKKFISSGLGIAKEQEREIRRQIAKLREGLKPLECRTEWGRDAAYRAYHDAQIALDSLVQAQWRRNAPATKTKVRFTAETIDMASGQFNISISERCYAEHCWKWTLQQLANVAMDMPKNWKPKK